MFSAGPSSCGLQGGMLGSVENVLAIPRIFSDYPAVPVIFDPVLTSGRVDALADAAMIDAIRELLLPKTTILTPNSLEARRLAEKNVLLTGTHENTFRVVNDLYGQHAAVQSTSWERLPGSYHGSGCTLASAVAAGLAHGMSVSEAVLKVSLSQKNYGACEFQNLFEGVEV